MSQGPSNPVQQSVTIGPFSNLKVTQLSISTTATQIAATPLAGRKKMVLKSDAAGSDTIWIGTTNTVTTTTGFAMIDGSYLYLEIDSTVTLWGIVATGTHTLYIMEQA